MNDPATTVVRFRDITQQPDYRAMHGADHRLPGCPKGFIEAHAGKEVRIYLAPRTPFAHYCGVERVWGVPADEVQRLTGTRPTHGEVVVCEHEVEID